MSAISKIRRALYGTASVLGDAQAIGSGSPERIAKRFIRKNLYRTFGRVMRRTIR